MLGESWLIVPILVLAGIYVYLKVNYGEKDPSRYDCADLDQDHKLEGGGCACCGKVFRRRNGQTGPKE